MWKRLKWYDSLLSALSLNKFIRIRNFDVHKQLEMDPCFTGSYFSVNVKFQNLLKCYAKYFHIISTNRVWIRDSCGCHQSPPYLNTYTSFLAFANAMVDIEARISILLKILNNHIKNEFGLKAGYGYLSVHLNLKFRNSPSSSLEKIM